jgi:hypothetical protein
MHARKAVAACQMNAWQPGWFHLYRFTAFRLGVDAAGHLNNAAAIVPCAKILGV